MTWSLIAATCARMVGIAQLVERCVVADVAGSSPVTSPMWRGSNLDRRNHSGSGLNLVTFRVSAAQFVGVRPGLPGSRRSAS